MIIRTAIRINIGRDYQYGKAMIGRTSVQQKKPNKRNDGRNNRNQKKCNIKDYHRYKDREKKNLCEGRYRMNNQQRSCNRPNGMVRMK
jgi:hypothetical protein